MNLLGIQNKKLVALV